MVADRGERGLVDLLNDGPRAEATDRRVLEAIGDQHPLLRAKAATGLEPVWAIPAHQRVTGLLLRTGRIRHALTASPFRGSPTAAELGDRLEDYQRTAVRGAVPTATAPAALEN